MGGAQTLTGCAEEPDRGDELPSAVVVTPETAVLEPGDELALSVEVQGELVLDDTVTWVLERAATDDELTEDGVFTAGAADEPRGVLVVAVSNQDDRVRGSASITVSPAFHELPDAVVESVVVTAPAASLEGGSTLQLHAVVEGLFLSNTAVTWTVTGEADDAIDAAGLLTAGAAKVDDRLLTVTAASVSDPQVSGTLELTVLAGDGVVTEVQVTPALATVQGGDSLDLDAVVSGTLLTDTSVLWTLEHAAFGDVVDADGVLTTGPAFSSPRTVTVVATSSYDSAASASAEVTVEPVAVAETGALYVDEGSPLDEARGPLGSQANPYADVQSAVSAAAEGATIFVAPGYYALGGVTLTGFADGVTLQGAGSDAVFLDASENAGYGLLLDQTTGVTLAGFTLDGTRHYGVKCTPPVHDLVLSDVVVQNSWRSEIDLNGVVNGLLVDVVARGMPIGDKGVGVALPSVHGVTFQNVTTVDNAWGGVGIYSGAYIDGVPDAGDDISIDATNRITEGIYIDDEFTAGDLVDFADNGLSIEAATYMITNTSFRDAADGRSDDFVLFAEDVEQVWDLLATFPTASLPDTLVRTLSRDEQALLAPGPDFLVLRGMRIQGALDAASEGARIDVGEGRFEGSIVVDAAVEVRGAGDRFTLIVPSADPGVHAVGTAADARAVVADLAVGGTSAVDGFLVGSHVTLSGVGARGNYAGIDFSAVAHDVIIEGSTFEGNTVGFRAGTTADLQQFRISDSHFDSNEQGMYVAASSTVASAFDDVEILRTTFDDNAIKGIYVEKLSNALLEDVWIDRSGVDPTYAFNNGIDINLKFGTYADLVLRRVVVTGSGLTGTQADPLVPAAVAIKARDDGATYGAVPASLAGVLLDDCTIEGPVNALRLGEAGKLNAGPTGVVVQDSDLEALGDPAGYAIVNVAQADVDASSGNALNGASGAAAASEVYGAADDAALGAVTLE